MPNWQRLVAFTLAEVLITLGIIGIVAAMTMPMLIAKYQKISTVTQLKKTYSTLSQALTMAQADYGDMSQWDFKPKNPENGDNTPLRESLTSFVGKYLAPYVKTVTDCGIGAKASKRCFYTWHATDGTAANFGPNDNDYRFILNDTSLIRLLYDNNAGDHTMGGILMFVDINGLKKPNTMGKDIFLMYLYSESNKIVMFGTGGSRDGLMNHSAWGCGSLKSGFFGGFFCGALIQQDGWVIKDDYPWF